MRILALETIAVEAARRSAYRSLARFNGCDVHLLVPVAWREQGGVMQAEAESDSLLHVHTTGIHFGFRQHRVLYSNLRRILRKLQPDVLYCDAEPENYTAAQCRLAIDRVSPRTRLALVSSRNLDYLSIGFPYRLAFTHRWCDNLLRRHPADVMFVRPRSTMHLLEAYGHSVVHLPHPVDTSLFAPETSPAHLTDVSTFTIGYVGRLTESKGVHVIVKSLMNLPRSVRALIVGQGPAQESLEELTRDLGVADRTRFVPAVPYARVPGILRSMDVLVLPSLPTSHWVEQFGRVLIESMACGTPVVASRSGEIPEVLGEGGILVEPGDEKELVRAIEHLLRNPSRRTTLGLAGRARVLQNYSADVVAGIMHSAFNACV